MSKNAAAYADVWSRAFQAGFAHASNQRLLSDDAFITARHTANDALDAFMDKLAEVEAIDETDEEEET